MGGGGTILRTADGGATWTPNNLLAVSFTDANTGTVVGGFCTRDCYGTILRTTDGGATWTPQPTPPHWQKLLLAVSFTDAKNGTAVGDAGTILRTEDGGATWTLQSGGTYPSLLAVSCTDAHTCTAVGYRGTILRTNDGGATWTRQSSGIIFDLYGVSFTDANTGTAVGYVGTILRTTDGGTTWTAQFSGTANGLSGISFTDANTGTAVGYVGTILRTTTGGETPPTVNCTATPDILWPPNGKSVLVTVSGSVIPGTAGTTYAVTDKYGEVEPSGDVTLAAAGGYSFEVSLVAARKGDDKDGRTYTIVVSSKDTLGHIGSCSAVVTVPHDQSH